VRYNYGKSTVQWRITRVSESKVKSKYVIVRPKVDQRAGQLSLPHLGHFYFLFKLIYIAP